MTSLTQHLTSLSTSTPYSVAVAHPFLKAAGEGKLDSSLLALWLSQDRIYASHAYPRFVGALIANIKFDAAHGLTSREEALNQRILKQLLVCLECVIKEAEFFKDTAQKCSLPVEGWKERKATRHYTAEMARVSGDGRIEDGLVFLWAMEKVYLDAWASVRKSLSSKSGGTNSAVAAFADNWSSPQFVKFVDDLAALVNDLGIQPGTETWKRAEHIWNRVVELEAEFWPEVGEESTHRIARGA
ncbi:hypothetical protein AX17_003150 [Amanita inopinata Kibby_2008]|nr:hypothetical protein AX17_003150 [Amanita inopinata Kibby_2008]